MAPGEHDPTPASPGSRGYPALPGAAAAFLAVIWTTGCSALVRLDGLTGGSAEDGAAGAPQSVADAGDPTDGGRGRATGDGTGAGTGGAPGGGSGASRDASPPALDSGEAGTEPAPIGPPDAAPCTPPTPGTLDVCTGFGAMLAPPVIDGVLDCGVPLWPMPVVDSSGPGPLPGSVQASVGAAWRPDGLYLFVSVTGAGASRYPAPTSAPAWCGDAIELFVDHDGLFPNAPSYDDPGTIQLVAVAPPGGGSSRVGEMFRQTTDLGPWGGSFVSESTGDGFTTEAFITAADLGLATWSLGAGGKIGLDVAIDIGASTQEPASCPRLGQFTIQIPQGTAGGCAAACDVREFCTPRLD